MPRFAASIRLLFVCLVASSAVACGGDGKDITGPGSGEPTPSYVELQSEAGDYIGGGRSYRYTQSNAIIQVAASGSHLSIHIDGDQWWYGDFQAPGDGAAARLAPGTYLGLTRYPFNDPAKGGLSWSGDGRGCNTLTGSFTVERVTYTAGVLSAIDLRFEQHCEGGTYALRGTIHWRADDTSGAPGPVTPIPANLWRPTLGATPSSGDFVYLESGAGDYIGGGQTYLYGENDGIVVSLTGGRLSVSVGGWSGDFQAMNSVTRPQVGYYPGLQRFPFHNPSKGGLSWSGNGRGCNELTGWFAIDSITYVGDVVTAVDLRFEQHCEGGTPALHGQIHWTR
jgi:hypothetical protein